MASLPARPIATTPNPAAPRLVPAEAPKLPLRTRVAIIAALSIASWATVLIPIALILRSN